MAHVEESERRGTANAGGGVSAEGGGQGDLCRAWLRFFLRAWVLGGRLVRVCV